MTTFARFVSLALAVSLVGCSSASEPITPPEAGVTYDLVTIDDSPLPFRVGSTVILRASVSLVAITRRYYSTSVDSVASEPSSFPLKGNGTYSIGGGTVELDPDHGGVLRGPGSESGFTVSDASHRYRYALAVGALPNS